jgi:ubiquinone/menaquinone biosynthesis C-methylase UbiE
MSVDSKTQQAPSPAQMYENFFVPAMFMPFAPDLIEQVAPQAGERVLDVACGTGAIARQLPPLVGPDGAVAGVDISPEMLEVARSISAGSAPAIDWTEGGAEDLPFDDESFDAVLCQQGLQFVGDRQTVLSEMYRVLAPGGRVGITVWQGVERQPAVLIVDKAIRREIGDALDVPYSLGDPDELRRLLETAGFDDVTTNEVTHPTHFAYSDQFTRMIVMAGVAVLPAFATMLEDDQKTTVAAIAREIDPGLQEYRVGDEIVSPMTANIAVGYKRA